MRMLWFTPKWPLPARCGSRQAAVRLIRAMTARGHIIDLLSLVDPHEHCDVHDLRRTIGVRNVFVLRKSSAPKSHLAKGLRAVADYICGEPLPVTIAPFGTRKIAQAVGDVLSGRRPNRPHECHVVSDDGAHTWEAIVYEGLHPAAHALLPSRPPRPALDSRPLIVYRAQNCETSLWRRSSALPEYRMARTIMEAQVRRIHATESMLLRSCDVLAAVSATDLDIFESEFGIDASRPELQRGVVPVGFEFEAPLDFPGAPNLLFVGKLDWEPNVHGLRWFLNEVWPRVHARRPDMTLSVVGSSASRQLASFIAANAGVNYAGEVPELSAVYRASSVAIAPIFFGGGTRVKVIEAAHYGRAVISTQCGVEGLRLAPGQNCFLAECAEEWIDRICTLDNETAQAAGRAAFDSLKLAFSEASAVSSFLRLLHAALRRDNGRQIGAHEFIAGGPSSCS